MLLICRKKHTMCTYTLYSVHQSRRRRYCTFNFIFTIDCLDNERRWLRLRMSRKLAREELNRRGAWQVKQKILLAYKKKKLTWILLAHVLCCCCCCLHKMSFNNFFKPDPILLCKALLRVPKLHMKWGRWTVKVKQKNIFKHVICKIKFLISWEEKLSCTTEIDFFLFL